MSPDVAYLARCAALRHRGLSPALMHDLQDAGNETLLAELEAVDDTVLQALTRLDQQRRAPAETCPHEQTEPVDVRDRSTGGTRTVAQICTSCLAQLPAAWGCTDCERADVTALCDWVTRLQLARPCQEHA